jgi:hypothetical protein
MTHESLGDGDWQEVVDRLGGAELIEKTARETGAFTRARGVKSPVDLLRLVLGYCLGERGLRSTSAWAAAIGLADISNVSLLKRLQRCGDWFAVLVSEALAVGAPEASQGRLIRAIDATTVPQAGKQAKAKNRVWRIHGAFDLPSERFGFFELTDQTGGEQLDRIPAVAGEIRLADRAHLQPGRMGRFLEAGADFVVRTGWKAAHWLDEKDEPFDLIAELRRSEKDGLVDRPIRIARKGGEPLALRLVATRKPKLAAEEAKAKARKAARKGGHQIMGETLVGAEWVLLVTSLDRETFSTEDILALYRLRWRIELAFKRLKSLVGLEGPPGKDPRSARPWVLAHLLTCILLEPLADEFGDSPHWSAAA